MSQETGDSFFLHHALVQAHRAAVHQELQAAGLLEVGHPHLLHILKNNDQTGGMTQRELADLLHISPPSMASSLKSLEKLGYLSRQRREGDARCNVIALTEKGLSAVEGCHAALLRADARMLADFTQEEKDALNQARCRMIANLQSSSAHPRKEG